MANKKSLKLFTCFLCCLLVFSALMGCKSGSDTVTEISLNKTVLAIEMTSTKTFTLTASVTPATSQKKVIWKSSDESVATVDGGVVTALKVGQADITASVEDSSALATCKLTVSNYGQDIKNDSDAYAKHISTTYFTSGEGGNNLFKEKTGSNDSSFLWGVFAGLGMQYRLVKNNPTNAEIKAQYKEMLNALLYYRKPINETTVKYSSGRGDKNGNVSNNSGVFFDDNIWVARNLLFAYEIFNEQYYLDEAKKVTNFIYTGWNDKIGGLVWNEAGLGDNGTEQENERGLSANACGIIVNASLYELTKEKSYLTWANKFYEFCKRVQDKETYIYYNGIHTKVNGADRSDGLINKALYSYNSGSMLIANSLLYRITKDEKYLTDLKLSAAAAYETFKQTDMSTNISFYGNDTWFNAILIEGFLDASAHMDVSEYMDVAKQFVKGLKQAPKNQYGCYTPNLVYNIQTGNTDNHLLTQSGLAEIMCLLASYYNV